MRCRLLLIALLSLSPLARAADPPPGLPPPAPQTGDFDITFTQRSPFSSFPALRKRMNVAADQLGPDYDLAHQPFPVYVPEHPDPGKKFGLVVGMVPDGIGEIAAPLRPILDRHDLIMVGIKPPHPPLGQQIGLCLDAVYNLEHRYPIDRSRIYLMGGGEWMEPIGWSSGDVFTGDVYVWWIGYFRPLGPNPPLFKEMPPAALLARAKTRPQVLSFKPDRSQAWYRKAIMSAMRQDGFDHVFYDEVAHDDIMGPVWFERVLSLLESVHESPEPTAQPPATAPAASRAASLLSLAQSYIDAGRTDLARGKLNQLIQQYPDDPAAAKARDLLRQIQGQ